MLITEPAAYKRPVRFAFSAHPVPPTLLFRIFYGVFICFDRNFKGQRRIHYFFFFSLRPKLGGGANEVGEEGSFNAEDFPIDFLNLMHIKSYSSFAIASPMNRLGVHVIFLFSPWLIPSTKSIFFYNGKCPVVFFLCYLSA